MAGGTERMVSCKCLFLIAQHTSARVWSEFKKSDDRVSDPSVYVHSSVAQWKKCLHSIKLKDSVLGIV